MSSDVRTNYQPSSPIHSTNIHVVRAGAVATGVIIFPQIYLGIKLNKEIHGHISDIGKELAAIPEDMDTITENTATREDKKKFIEEIARQHSCLEEVKSIFAGETK